MTLNVKIWGPYMWYILHMVSYGYKDAFANQEKNDYIEFVNRVAGALPCTVCRSHFIQKINARKPNDNVTSRNKIINYFITMHNEVNRATGKTVWSRQMADKFYDGKPMNHANVVKFLDLAIILQRTYDVNSMINFIKALAKVYPTREYREKLVKISDDFANKKIKKVETFREEYKRSFRPAFISLYIGKINKPVVKKTVKKSGGCGCNKTTSKKTYVQGRGFTTISPAEFNRLVKRR